MSFPQPLADPYAVNNYEFFRLFTPLSSPGDIYQSTQGCHALCIGPNSDVANVNVAYFDDQVSPTFLQTMTISPTRSFTGLLNARNEASYAPAGRPGRILFWADDIFDPNFRPRGFNSVTDTIVFVAPQLDIVQYFAPQNSLVPPRSDKSFVFQNYNISAGVGNLVVPYYGRKYCYIQFTNRNTITPNTFGITGVNYAITQDNTPNPYTQETTIHAAAAVAPGASVTVIITAQAVGVFDALLFSLTDAGPAPLRIVMSDAMGV
jgi:hypothetical protein